MDALLGALPRLDPMFVRALYFGALILTLLLFWSSRKTPKEQRRLAFRWANVKDVHDWLGNLEQEGSVDQVTLRTDREPNALGKIRLSLREAGITRITAVEWVAMRIIASVIVLILVIVTLQSTVIAFALAFVVYSIPGSRLAGARVKRTVLLEKQLMKAALRMSSSSGTGTTMPTAVRELATSIDPPLGPVFVEIGRRLDNKMSFAEAVRQSEADVSTDEYRMFSLALRAVQEFGAGKAFSETMTILADRLQERARLRSEAAAAFQQMKGGYYFVMLMLIGLTFFLYQNDPEAYTPLLVHPVGQVATMFALAWAYLGHRLLQGRAKLESAL